MWVQAGGIAHGCPGKGGKDKGGKDVAGEHKPFLGFLLPLSCTWSSGSGKRPLQHVR